MNEMKTTADALRWALSVIAANKLKLLGDSTIADAIQLDSDLFRAKEILALAEFVESDESPDYSKDGGFEALLDTTPAAYALPDSDEGK